GLRVQRLQLAAVLRLDDLPAGGLEIAFDLADADAGDDPVEALAVEVDDHRDVAEAAEGVLDRRLPDGALVELGIAHERDKPAVGPAAGRLAQGVAQIAGREARLTQ